MTFGDVIQHKQQPATVQNSITSSLSHSHSRSRSNRLNHTPNTVLSMNLGSHRKNASWPWLKMNVICRLLMQAPTAARRRLQVCHTYPPNKNQQNFTNIPHNNNRSHNMLTASALHGLHRPVARSNSHKHRLWHCTNVRRRQLHLPRREVMPNNSQPHLELRATHILPWLIQRVRRLHQLQPLWVHHLGALPKYIGNLLIPLNCNSNNLPVHIPLNLTTRPIQPLPWVTHRPQQLLLQQSSNRIFTLLPYKATCIVGLLSLFHRLHQLTHTIVLLWPLHRPIIAQVVR